MTEAIITGINTDARFIGKFVNGSPEWHEQRSKGIGGSDVGVICGLSEWVSPYTWAAKRLGKIPSDQETSEAMLWGTLLEDVIINQWHAENSHLLLAKDAGTWHHKDREWQQANPDGLYSADGGKTWGIVEVKTARYEDHWAKGKDGQPDTIPATYRAQVLWYLQTFGLQHAYVVVLFGGSKLRTFEVVYDDFEAEANYATVAHFLDTFITPQVMPPFSAPYNSTLETVRYMHPDIEDTEVELGDKGREYYDAIRQLDELQAIVDDCKAEVLQLMGSAKRGLLDGNWVVTRQARGSGMPFLVNKR
jgi:putative phage-type endonuclease